MTADEKELMRLGKKYRKNRHKGKYIILIAAIVCALGVGVTTIGGPKRAIEKVQGMIEGREQINIDTNGERTGETKSVSEFEAYEQIEEEYGFVPVFLDYMPDGVEFAGLDIDESIHSIQLSYKGQKSERVLYRIFPGYRTATTGFYLDDEVIEQYSKQIEGNDITVYELQVENSTLKKWKICFIYQEIQYTLLLTDLEKEEVDQIVEHLYFS